MAKVKKKPVTSKDKESVEGVGLSSDDKCAGILHGEGVQVEQPDHICRLSQLGCYGKGIFSRSVPTHHSLPELDELIRQTPERKKSRTVVSDTTEAGASSTHTALAAPKSRSERSEWREKLKMIEEEEVKRIELHSMWKEEKEKQSSKDVSTCTASGEQTPSHFDQGKSCRSRFNEDKMDTSSNVIEKSYRDFMERVMQLRKTDPYPVKEHLQLSSEEATYLAMELDLLRVFSPDDGSLLNPETLWTHFSSINNRFVEQYAAYHYYRSKGWVPKSGLKFGVDFLLYKEGPSFYHSTYAVVVVLIEECLEPSIESLRKPPASRLTWREVIALDRVNSAAGKELIVCYVVKPPFLSQDQLKLPTCLGSLQVREVVVKRWVPEKERQ